MERTHRELRTRLTNRLGSDYTNGFANIDKVTTTQIATIAVAADPVSCLTRDRAANFNLVHTHGFDFIGQLLIDKRASSDQQFVACRVKYVFCNHSAKNAGSETSNYIASLDHGIHNEALVSTEVLLRDNQILGNVD